MKASRKEPSTKALLVGAILSHIRHRSIWNPEITMLDNGAHSSMIDNGVPRPRPVARFRYDAASGQALEQHPLGPPGYACFSG